MAIEFVAPKPDGLVIESDPQGFAKKIEIDLIGLEAVCASANGIATRLNVILPKGNFIIVANVGGTWIVKFPCGAEVSCKLSINTDRHRFEVIARREA